MNTHSRFMLSDTLYSVFFFLDTVLNEHPVAFLLLGLMCEGRLRAGY
jgi:hypothetical protein